MGVTPTDPTTPAASPPQPKPVSMRTVIVLFVLSILLFVAAIASQVVQRDTSDPQPSTPPQLTFVPAGECSTDDGTLTASKVSGFTPGGEHVTVALKPTGEVYPPDDIINPGRVADDGTLPEWKWPRAGDPAGDYLILVIDRMSGGVATFTIEVKS